MGQKYLATGKSLSMRLWEHEQPGEPKSEMRRDYETVGYLTLSYLKEGDSRFYGRI